MRPFDVKARILTRSRHVAGRGGLTLGAMMGREDSMERPIAKGGNVEVFMKG